MLRKFYFDRILKNSIFRGISLSLIKENDSFSKLKKIETYNKSIKNVYLNKRSYLTKNLIGSRIFVHNGKEIVSLKILPSMVGFKIGEFFYTKKNKKLVK
jgi:ribosomal protein S19